MKKYMRNSEHSEAGQTRKIRPRMVRAGGWGGARTSRRGCRGVKGREHLSGRLAGTVPRAAQCCPEATYREGRRGSPLLSNTEVSSNFGKISIRGKAGPERGMGWKVHGSGERRGESSMDGKCSLAVGL